MERLKYPAKPKGHDFVLGVVHNDQIDNKGSTSSGPGWRQCNATSAAMLAKYLKPALWASYKDFANGMLDALEPYGDTTDHTAITKALRSIGIESYFSYTASVEDVAHALYCGVPVILGCKYKGSGHMVLAIGRNKGGLIIHCPYGDRAGTTDTWNAIGNGSGKEQSASWSWLNNVVFDMGDEAGWARFVTCVDGKATGVTSGL